LASQQTINGGQEVPSAAAGGLRILVLSDRDWTHPDAGGTGTTLYALLRRWADWGHHVALLTGAYDGAVSFEQPHPRLEIHRSGSRLSVFPRAALAHFRGAGRQPDVVFEIVNGIAFFTSLWPSLRAPRVVFVQHVHQEHYVTELGWKGRPPRFLLERLPLRRLYGGCTVLTISDSARSDLIDLGVYPSAIEVHRLGVEPATSSQPEASQPTLLYLGRLKRYKRLELLLELLEANPGAILEIAGDGDYRPELELKIERRGLRDRVLLHGFVPESYKPVLYSRAWVNLTTSSAEGWGLSVMEAAVCGTPSAALRVGGLSEAILDGETGALADDVDELALRVGEILSSPELRRRLGEAASERAHRFSWDRAAEQFLAALQTAAMVSRGMPTVSPDTAAMASDDEPSAAPAAELADPEAVSSG
jgi:glycosyltransferase involved in cell wall biosynthesis